MSKQKTPDDIPTNIGHTKPEVGWLGHPRDYGFYAERGGSIVSDFYPSIFDAVLAYPHAIINDEAMAQLTEGEKRVLAKPTRMGIPMAGAENLVCLSEKFHNHPDYHQFYGTYCNALHGFTGIYDLIIRMAEALTDWEENRGGKELYDHTEVIWDDLAQIYVDKYFDAALNDSDGDLPDVHGIFETVEPQNGGHHNNSIPRTNPAPTKGLTP